MAQKITKDDGTEIEVYTAEEVQTKTQEAVKAREDEFGKTQKQIEAERDDARKALDERNKEVKGFRKLSEDQTAKLSVVERTLYENQKAAQEEKEKREASDKLRVDAQVDAAIKVKAGKDEKLAARMKEMWAVIGIEALTPEDIEKKSNMVLGAIGMSQPDLVASIVGVNGGFMPPVDNKKGDEDFASTERGKAAAAELGLKLEADKK